MSYLLEEYKLLQSVVDNFLNFDDVGNLRNDYSTVTPLIEDKRKGL